MNSAILNSTKLNSKVLVFDFLALMAIYFVPVLSHKFSLPIYYIEPMRIAILFSILFANKTNSIIIAITLPLFSFIVSAHPVFMKTLLIATELVMNVILFYWFLKLIKNATISFAIAVIASKVYYYLVKFLLLQSALLNGSFVSTPLTVQLIVFGFVTLIFFSISKIRNKI